MRGSPVHEPTPLAIGAKVRDTISSPTGAGVTGRRAFMRPRFSEARRQRGSAQTSIYRARVESLEERCLPSSASLLPQSPSTPALLSSYAQLPLAFEANEGQTDAQVQFLSRGNGYSLFLTPAEAVLELPGPETAPGAATATVLQLQL